jgi:two-component system NarL family response regulator
VRHYRAVTLKVVLVDDDAQYRLIARRSREREGVSVVAEAADGCTALAVLQDCSADVVLLDIGLPDISGAEVARRMLVADRTPTVILISTRDPDYGCRVAEGVAAGFIAKDALCLAAIRGILEPSGT